MTQPSATRRTNLLLWLLLALSAAICVAWFLAARGYWEDDAYIHLEFARSLAQGQGFRFNGYIVYGDTSPLWVALLVAFHAVIPDWLAAGKTLAACATVFALSGVFVYARSLVRSAFTPQAADTFAAAMLLVFVTLPYFGYWAFSGMEALAAAGLAAWAAAVLADSQDQPITPARFALAALAAGLAPLLRPEMAFLSLLLAVLLLRRWATMPDRSLPALAGAALLACAPVVVWGIYAVRTFGSLLPNTNGAKRAAPTDSVLSRLLHLYGFGFPVVLLALLLLAAWLLWAALRRREIAIPFAALPAGIWLLLIWSALNAVFYIANHTFVQTRYLFVTAPLLTIALLAAFAVRWPRAYGGLLTFALMYGAVISLQATRPLVRNKVRLDAVWVELAAELHTLPPDSAVATYSIGEIGFLSEHPLVDTGGITRPGAVAYLWDPNDDRRTAWIYGQGAQYEIIDHQPLPGATLLWSRPVPLTGWYFQPAMYDRTETLQLWKLPPRN
jgi:hypothetical protein